MAVIISDAPDRRALGLLASTSVTLGAAVFGAGMNLVLAVIIGRTYGAGATGTFFATIGVFLVAANVLKLGADTGLVRMLSRAVALGRERDIVPTIAGALWPVLVVSIIAASLAAWNAEWIALWVRPQDPGPAVSLVRFLAAGVPLLTLFALLTAIVRGLGGLTAFAVLQNVLLPLSRVIGILSALWLGRSIAQATQLWAAGLPVLVVLAALVAVSRVRRALRAAPTDAPTHSPTDSPTDTAVQPELAPTVFAAFWRFTVPRAGSASIEIGIEWLDVILVSALAGPVEGGLYAVATRLVKVASIADYALRMALSTRLTAALATGDVELLRRLYGAGTRLLVGLVWPYLAVLVVFSDVAVTLFGGDFGPGTSLVSIVAIGMLVVAAGGSLQSMLLLSGLSRQQLSNKVAVLGITIGGNLAVTPHWGARGAAVVWVVAVVTDTALAAFQVRRRVGVAVGLGPLRDVGIAALAGGLVCALLLRSTLGPSLPVMAAAGLASLALLALLVSRSDVLHRAKIFGGIAR